MRIIVQREKARGKVMNPELKISLSETYAYIVNKQMKNDRPYRGKHPDLKCHNCDHNLGHSIKRCWIFHSEMKPNFEKEKRSKKGYGYKVHVAVHSINSLPSNVENFSTNLSALLNDFVAYL